MDWLLANKFNARPIVTVEDHVYHISELLRIIQASHHAVLESLTVVCLDRSGPDTDAAVNDWLSAYPALQIAARIEDSQPLDAYSDRLVFLPNPVFQDQNHYCRQIARLLRPQGLLIQDIELETLEFVPRDRWWESTMLASTVRGIVNDRAPRCAFISNKRGYEATFGAELLAAGHDPRDVLNKYELEQVALPFLTKYLNSNFPDELTWVTGNNSNDAKLPQSCRVSLSKEERTTVESHLDIVVWPVRDQSSEVGGKAFETGKKSRFVLSSDGNEFETWRQLVRARLGNQPGVEVQTTGQRVAPTGALRAETTNAAARHIHSLRKRLVNPQDIVTTDGHYRLRDGLSVGVAETI